MTSACFGMDSNNANLTYMIAKFRLVWNHSGISETQLDHKAYGLNFPEDQGMDKIFQGNCNIIYLHDHMIPQGFPMIPVFPLFSSSKTNIPNDSQ